MSSSLLRPLSSRLSPKSFSSSSSSSFSSNFSRNFSSDHHHGPRYDHGFYWGYNRAVAALGLVFSSAFLITVTQPSWFDGKVKPQGHDDE